LPAPPEAQPNPPEPATTHTPGLPFVWHTPATHVAFAAQSESRLQVLVPHELPLQALPPHELCAGAGHVPEPLHDAAWVITPDEQVWPRHWTAAPGYPHCVGLLPSQAPPQAVPSEVQAWREPWGAPATLVQVPTWPGTSHAWHCPPQAALQHTPSTHRPLAHWLGPPHAAPFASAAVQMPAEQKLPDAQSASVAQLPRHAEAPHTYGLHPCVWRAGQLPAPSR